MPTRENTAPLKASNNKNFSLGVIEGFYGTPWNKDIRKSYFSWFLDNGYSFYIYAPKNDPHLRRQWFQEFSPDYLQELIDLREEAHKHNVRFGIGFTPLNAVNEGSNILNKVKAQAKAIFNTIKPDILAILFDDLKITSQNIGASQNAIIKAILEEGGDNTHIISCPSFYSFDPILEKIFGAMPEGYFQEFTAGLLKELDLFWTGDLVMSTGYSEEGLKRAQDILGKKPFIWDNYPVNDGRKTSGHIYLNPAESRKAVLTHSCGLAVNPMKEALLNKIPLGAFSKTLFETDITEERRTEIYQECLFKECGNTLGSFILKEAPNFSKTDLAEISEDEITSLIKKLQNITGDREIINEYCDFLKGKYAFDPACLTG